MFSGAKQLAENIYLYENFLDKKDNEYMLELIKFQNDDEWKRVGEQENTILTLRTDIIEPLILKVHSICPEGLDTVYNSSVNQIREGIIYGEHIDTNTSKHILDASKKYIDGEEFIFGDYPRFGLVFYFNDDYDDGEIYYPEMKVSHKPKSGDLVIHSADILHGTRPPKNGVRYTYTAAYTEKLKMSKNVI
jgi:predicted 2-oxoglutarate/Fe(II)-dependent dioxygenase YbiX